MDLKAIRPICEDCGEDDPVKFSPNKLKKCKPCSIIHSNKIRGIKIVERDAKCSVCGTTEPHRFHRNMTRCKDCSREQRLVGIDYACKICGENRKPEFYLKENSVCKTCIRMAGTKNLVSTGETTFICCKCGAIGKENFYKGDSSMCKGCHNRAIAEYYYPFYSQLVEAQGKEACAVCGKGPKGSTAWRLNIDFDQDTGVVRGLLCSDCVFKARKIEGGESAALVKYLNAPPARGLNIQCPQRKV